MNERRCLLPGPSIDFQDFADFPRSPVGVFVHRFSNYTMYFAKSYPAGQESLYRDFVGTVQYHRHRARLAQRLISSLASDVDADVEKVWLQEAARRLAELKAGKIAGIPAEKVLRKARSALR